MEAVLFTSPLQCVAHGLLARIKAIPDASLGADFTRQDIGQVAVECANARAVHAIAPGENILLADEAKCLKSNYAVCHRLLRRAASGYVGECELLTLDELDRDHFASIRRRRCGEYRGGIRLVPGFGG